MSRKTQASRTELNFDGLTDTTTNLVGGLILLLVLVIASTQEVVRGQKRPPAAPEEKAGEVVAIDPLVERMERMKFELDESAQKIRAVEERIPELEQELADLGRRGK